MTGLLDKVVVVTGAARGTGRPMENFVNDPMW
jgi:NADP-dependent 3-hydroxy acid dehydrogenase YdfG